MKSSCWAALLAVAAAACSTDSGVNPTQQRGWFLHLQKEPATTQPRITLSPLSTVSTESAGGERLRRTINASALGPATFALAPRKAIHGAVAKIVRDPHATRPRIIVFAEGYVTDDLVRRASYFLLQDEIAVPTPQVRRVITVYPSMVLKREGDDGVKWRQISIKQIGANEVATRPEEQITGGTSTRGIDVAGIGIVYPFNTQWTGPATH